MAFYAHILHDNPEEVLPFAKRIAIETKRARAAFGTEAIAYGASKDRNKALSIIAEAFDLPEDSLEKYKSLEIYPYPSMEPKNQQLLDVLWASFFATGKSSYIEKIAEPLVHFHVMNEEYVEELRRLSNKNPKPGSKEYKELWSGITAQASLFGLIANAANDPVVLEALREIAYSGNGRVNELASKIVRKADERKNLKVSDKALQPKWKKNGKIIQKSSWQKSKGDFGASLIVTDNLEKLFKDWLGPAEIVKISPATKVKRGQVIGAVVIFSYRETHHLWWWTRIGSTDPARNKIGSSSGKASFRGQRRKSLCMIGVAYRMCDGIANTMW